MEFMLKFLPIVIYFLLIIAIIVGIILGIKLIITVDKVNRIADDIENKMKKVEPIFSIMEFASDRVSDVVSTVVGFFEKLFSKIFLRNKEVEEDDYE